ncbi:MAG: aldo/keto reductase [Candidatus Sulfotelmatobacter sp.]
MERRQLGDSDLHITRLGIGAWAIGGGGWNGSMGPQNESDSIPAIHAALDYGLNWVDTTALYGLGHSEAVVAEALRGRRQRPYVFTKCERVWDASGTIGARLKDASIRKECEDSLCRLQVDTIDLYQIHWPEPDEDIEEGWTELARLKQEGKVRYIGVSNFAVSQMKRAQAIAAITSLQPPYSLVTRQIEKEILPFALEQNIGVIVYSPMCRSAHGSHDARKGSKLCGRGLAQKSSQLPGTAVVPQSETGRVAARDRKPAGTHAPGEVAIAWTLKNPAVTGAIVGFRNPQQVSGIVGAAEFSLGPTEMAEIEDALK